MRRPSWYVFPFVLLTATGLALLQLSAAVSSPPLAFPAARSNTTLAREFYDAINRVLATGDPASLAPAVAPDFAAHGLHPAPTVDMAVMQDYLVSLHTSFPGVQLDIVEIVAGREVVMARIALYGVDGGRLPGLPVSGPVGLWGRVDTLRFDEGGVAELWSDGGGVDLRPLFASLPSAIEPGSTVAVDRFTLAGRVVSTATVPLLLFLDSGSLDVWLPDSGLGEGRGVLRPVITSGVPGAKERQIRTVASGPATTLRPHEVLAIPPGTVYQLLVPLGQVAGGLSVRLIPSMPPGGVVETGSPVDNRVLFTTGQRAASEDGEGDRTLPAVVEVDPLMRWEVVDQAGEPQRLLAGRITLGPSASLIVGAVPAMTMLAVETGILGLTVEGQVRPAPSTDGVLARGPVGLGYSETLAVGGSALLQTGAEATVRNLGAAPLTVLVIVASVIGSDEM